MIAKELKDVYKFSCDEARFYPVHFENDTFYATNGHVLLSQKSAEKIKTGNYNPFTGEEDTGRFPEMDIVNKILNPVNPFEFKVDSLEVLKLKAGIKYFTKKIVALTINGQKHYFNFDYFNKIFFDGTEGIFYYNEKALVYKTLNSACCVMELRTDEDNYIKLKSCNLSNFQKKAPKTCFIVFKDSKHFKIFEKLKDAEETALNCVNATIKEVVLN